MTLHSKTKNNKTPDEDELNAELFLMCRRKIYIHVSILLKQHLARAGSSICERADKGNV